MSTDSILLYMFSAGSVVGHIPHALLIQKIAPRIYLPLNLIFWSGVTTCLAACKTHEGLCAARFFQSFLEASIYASSMYVFDSWYKPSELSKRAAIFTAVGQLGSLFAGIMMTAMNQSLHGNSGLKVWQWVFLINGLTGIPVGVFGLFFFPDLPETTKASYLGREEVHIATERLPAKKLDSHDIQWRTLLPKVIRSPYIYVLAGLSVVGGMLEAFALSRHLDDKTKNSQSNDSDDEAVGEVVSEQQMTKIG
ncbi:pantothenate transporter-like protein [Aureobasidium pullulans]|uniref:Pantothenate transporter-like protein n=1 Tax=Aureobasidium pullulans TaxID=5580 RepID=A0A4S9PEU2_AURPU|nr:pantothenate transporter-like protein [Aureobasidium pullulans]THZ38634.1 pantothenate transporter-like protein [Aureobasidium pullulans]THZ52689.1 pantothenate transporter-like protein [Aureobasidium pullulans]